MARSLSQVTMDALRLPPKSRGKLIDRLFDALDPQIDTDAEASWKAEVARRLKQDKAGKLRYTSAGKVLASMRKFLNK